MPLLFGNTASAGVGFSSLGSYFSIATATVTTATSSITFTDIPQTYSHLDLRYIARTSVAGTDDYIKVSFNGSTASINSFHALGGNMSTASTVSGTSQQYSYLAPVSGNTAGANTFATGVATITEYTSTLKNKTIRTIGGYNNNGGGNMRLEGSLWANTAAITSITLTVDSGANFVTNSKFYLYGVM